MHSMSTSGPASSRSVATNSSSKPGQEAAVDVGGRLARHHVHLVAGLEHRRVGGVAGSPRRACGRRCRTPRPAPRRSPASPRCRPARPLRRAAPASSGSAAPATGAGRSGPPPRRAWSRRCRVAASTRDRRGPARSAASRPSPSRRPRSGRAGGRGRWRRTRRPRRRPRCSPRTTRGAARTSGPAPLVPAGLLVGGEAEHHRPVRDCAGTGARAHDREQHRVEVLHVDRAATPDADRRGSRR